VAPAEAAQERPEGRGGLDGEAEDPLGVARPQGVRIVDAVTAGEGREDEGQQLVADVRPAGRSAEVEVGLDELAQAEMLGEGGRQEEARVGHELRPVERRAEPVEAVG